MHLHLSALSDLPLRCHQNTRASCTNSYPAELRFDDGLITLKGQDVLRHTGFSVAGFLAGGVGVVGGCLTEEVKLCCVVTSPHRPAMHLLILLLNQRQGTHTIKSTLLFLSLIPLISDKQMQLDSESLFSLTLSVFSIVLAWMTAAAHGLEGQFHTFGKYPSCRRPFVANVSSFFPLILSGSSS